jgi:hypothetical protein
LAEGVVAPQPAGLEPVSRRFSTTMSAFVDGDDGGSQRLLGLKLLGILVGNACMRLIRKG